MDARCKRIVLPPNCAAFCTTKAGIFEDTTSFWRMSSKMQVFLMLPVLFMGTVPSLYNPLTKLAHGVILLIGRVISERFRRSKGYVALLVYSCAPYRCITTFTPHLTGTEHVSIMCSPMILKRPIRSFQKECPSSHRRRPRVPINHMHTTLCTTRNALICSRHCLDNGCSEMREETRCT